MLSLFFVFSLPPWVLLVLLLWFSLVDPAVAAAAIDTLCGGCTFWLPRWPVATASFSPFLLLFHVNGCWLVKTTTLSSLFVYVVVDYETPSFTCCAYLGLQQSPAKAVGRSHRCRRLSVEKEKTLDSSFTARTSIRCFFFFFWRDRQGGCDALLFLFLLCLKADRFFFLLVLFSTACVSLCSFFFLPLFSLFHFSGCTAEIFFFFSLCLCLGVHVYGVCVCRWLCVCAWVCLSVCVCG